MLSIERIREELNSLGVSAPEIIYYDLIDSTNTRAKEFARENPENSDTVVFIADGQTAGRGRRGRSFVSERGAGIYISLLTYPKDRGFDATAVTARAAVCLARAIESLCECEIKIKWVNDLYLGGRKLAGILTEGEMGYDGKIAYQVVGMGINVYKNAIFEEISDIATSIEGETNCRVDRSKLAAQIIAEFLSETPDCYEEYKSRSNIIGKKVTVLKPNESYVADVLDINPDFSLKIQTDQGVENLFTGEVSLKISK